MLVFLCLRRDAAASRILTSRRAAGRLVNGTGWREGPQETQAMRTTLDIADDVLTAVRSLAGQRGESMGHVLSELARQVLDPGKPGRTRNGVSLFEPEAEAEPATRELVNELRDGDGAR